MQHAKHMVYRRQHSHDMRKIKTCTPMRIQNFTEEYLDDELESHCLALEERYFGLTRDDLRRLVF